MPTSEESIENTGEVEVYFTKQEYSCTEKIISAIDRAQASILVHAYAFTATDIANALIRASSRGVDVKLLIDSTYKNKPCVKELTNHGILVYVDDVSGIAHTKIMIIDSATVITGSFNFSDGAEKRNVENLCIFHSSKIAATYTKHWHQRYNCPTTYCYV